MGTRTISVSDEAYIRLRSLKRPGESFSDVINRLTKRRRLSEIAGSLDEDDVRDLVKVIASMRARSRGRLEKTLEELAG